MVFAQRTDTHVAPSLTSRTKVTAVGPERTGNIFCLGIRVKVVFRRYVNEVSDVADRSRKIDGVCFAVPSAVCSAQD